MSEEMISRPKSTLACVAGSVSVLLVDCVGSSSSKAINGIFDFGISTIAAAFCTPGRVLRPLRFAIREERRG